MATNLLYMDNSQLYQCQSKLVKIEAIEDGSSALILDKSIFYPKGGGQPCDKGVVSINGKNIAVNKVFYADGEVYHVIDNSHAENFELGCEVSLNVDAVVRNTYSKLHTLTHLVDDAMFEMGYSFNPLSGCSYVDSTYVEYEGTLEGIVSKEDLKFSLEEKINNFIKQGFDVRTSYVKREDLSKACYKFPADVASIDKPLRVVITHGDKGIACGGTHVKNISELGGAVIKKISDKKGIIRVSCNLAKE
ncbi:MAG: alanine--tRNA ligase-related protein [Alphaproteobacteria bacterium]|nr:alanine--tRNA ligase-related protein [Alphaproteobacteria bacterium]